MPSRRAPRARQAIDEAHEWLGRADSAIQRVRDELGGEPRQLAARLSMQIRFMREVAELLAHEMERGTAALEPGSEPEFSSGGVPELPYRRP